MKKELAKKELERKNIKLEDCFFTSNFVRLYLGIAEVEDDGHRFFIEVHDADGICNSYLMDSDIVEVTLRKAPHLPFKYKVVPDSFILSEDAAQNLLEYLSAQTRVSIQALLGDVRIDIHFEGEYFNFATLDCLYGVKFLNNCEVIGELELKDDDGQSLNPEQFEQKKIDELRKVIGNDFAEEYSIGQI